MKYMNNGGFSQNPMMRLTLLFTMFFLFGFLVVNFLLFFNKMELSPDSIASYYRGSEEEFRPARTYQSMLEVTHSHLPVMAVVMLVLTHLVIFTPASKGAKYSFIVIAFMSAFMNEASNYLIRFVDPDFAWLKIFTFLSLQASISLLIIILITFLIRSHFKKSEEDLIEVQ
ncbi:MAG: hypothetical protein ACYC09_07225 [Bacteroidota bacterium]